MRALADEAALSSPDAWVLRADELLRTGEPEAARRVVLAALRFWPDSSALWAARADVARALGREARAIEAARRAALLAPASADLQAKIISLLESLGDWGGALAGYRKLLGMKRASVDRAIRRGSAASEIRWRAADAWGGLARAALRAGEPRVARRAVLRALRLSPRSLLLWVLRLEIEESLGMKAEALRAARRAAGLAPACVDIQVKVISLLAESGDTRAAFARCAAALERVAQKWGVLQMKASLQMREGRRREAERTLRRALAFVREAIASGETGGPREAAFLELAAAEIYEDLADLARSAAHLRRAVGLDPGNVLGLGKLAQMSLWRGEYEEASQQAAKALSLDSSYAMALRVQRAAAAFRGDSWARGPLDRRWELIEREFQFEPRCAPLRLRVGRRLLRRGHAREALRCFEGALMMDPGSREAQRGKAAALRRLVAGR